MYLYMGVNTNSASIINNPSLKSTLQSTVNDRRSLHRNHGECERTLIFSPTGCLRTHGNVVKHTCSNLTHHAQSHLGLCQETNTHKDTLTQSKKLFEKNEIIEGQSQEKLRSRKASMSKKFVLPVLLTSMILLKCLNKSSWLKKKKGVDLSH